MMVGHAMVAFALGTAVARRRGRAPGSALAVGATAGAFATVPDVDMLYALVGLSQVGVAGVWEMTAAFWGSSTLVHRSVTHSLVVGAVAALAFAASVTPRFRGPAAALLVGLAALGYAESGLLGGTVLVAFVLAGLGVALAASRLTELGPREVLAAALLGLLTHPFGDVFTGIPPRFLYPADVAVMTERAALAADPTLNLVAVFGLELATVWLAGLVYLRATRRRPSAHVDARAAAGVAYAVAAIALPAPTLDVSYHFVFSILAVGVVGVAPGLLPARSVRSAGRDEAVTWATTGLAAVSFAALAYTLAYLLYPLP